MSTSVFIFKTPGSVGQNKQTTTIHKLTPTTNYGDDTELNLYGGTVSAAVERRILYRRNLTATPDTGPSIPATLIADGGTIDSATFAFWIRAGDFVKEEDGGGQLFYIEPLDNSGGNLWKRAEVTWNKRSTTPDVSWGTPGGDLSGDTLEFEWGVINSGLNELEVGSLVVIIFQAYSGVFDCALRATGPNVLDNLNFATPSMMEPDANLVADFGSGAIFATLTVDWTPAPVKKRSPSGGVALSSPMSY